jgi:hypothetical protein
MEMNREHAQYVGYLIKTYLYYATRTITPIGITLNICSFLIFTRQNFQKTTMGFYNMALALFDIFALTISFVIYFPISINSDLNLISDISCKSIQFLLRTLTQIPSWLQVMIACDRLLSIKYPSKFLYLNNRKILSAIIGAIIIQVSILNIPNFFFFTAKKYINESASTRTRNISKVCTSSYEILLTRDLIGVLNRTIIPFTIMIILNIKIIKQLVKVRSILWKNRPRPDENLRNKRQRKEYQFAFSILAINAFFLIILFPLAFCQVLKYALSVGITIENQRLTVAIVNLEFACFVSVYISLLNNALSFFVNMIFNRIFRKEVKQILSSCGQLIGTHFSHFKSSS